MRLKISCLKEPDYIDKSKISAYICSIVSEKRNFNLKLFAYENHHRRNGIRRACNGYLFC